MRDETAVGQTAETASRPATSCLLVGLDGSAESTLALEWAATTASHLAVLVVAVTPLESLADCLCGPTEPRERERQAEIRRAIIHVIERHPRVDIAHWRVGGPLVASLCRMARDDDLLVLPVSRGSRPGSDVWTYCREHARCTIIFVPVDPPAERENTPLANVPGGRPASHPC